MAVWLLRLLLLLAIVVNMAMAAVWAYAAYLVFLVSGSADAESQRWALSATLFLAVSLGLIALGLLGIVKGWKLGQRQHFGAAARWVGLPMLLQLAVMLLL